MKENKVYCNECKNYHTENRSIKHGGNWNSLNKIEEYVYCKHRLDSWERPNCVEPNPMELNKNNDCKYFIKGTPTHKETKEKVRIGCDVGG
jgi:hypothetical protein